jgi:pyruvate dehydrogenase E1 component alpha subunit
MLAQQQAQKVLAGKRAGGQAVRPCRRALSVRAVATTQKKEASSAKPKYNVTPEVAKDLYYDMVLGREFEEMCAQMYYRGKMFGFVHLYCGQEAVSTGVIGAMEARDYVCSTYRDHVHALSKGERRAPPLAG